MFFLSLMCSTPQLKSLKNHPLLESRGEGLNRGLPALSHEAALTLQQALKLESVSTAALIGASVRLQVRIVSPPEDCHAG